MSQESLSTSFISLRAGLMRAVRGIVPPKEIEDIVQETYVKACQAGKTREILAPRAFLYKTARNLAIDHMKRSETRLADSIDYENVTPLMGGQHLADKTLEQACSDEEFSQFCEAVRLLPTACRKTFVLKKVYGYSQREIAEELGLSESTVEKHIAQGVKRCAYYMAQREKQAFEPVPENVLQKKR